MSRQTYSSETKAAVMAALLAGQSISEVARQHKVPRGTVGYWAGQMDRSVQIGPNTKKEIGALILSYLKALLETLQIQVVAFRDEAWLRKQDASEVAVLHGVLADKGIRLLEALAEESPSDDTV